MKNLTLEDFMKKIIALALSILCTSSLFAAVVKDAKLDVTKKLIVIDALVQTACPTKSVKLSVGTCEEQCIPGSDCVMACMASLEEKQDTTNCITGSPAYQATTIIVPVPNKYRGKRLDINGELDETVGWDSLVSIVLPK